MSEPVIITVVLKPISDRAETVKITGAFKMLEDWADQNNLVIQPPVTDDEETLRFTALLIGDANQANAVIAKLERKPFVDAAYIKPADELP